jgi:hypothetical protein
MEMNSQTPPGDDTDPRILPLVIAYVIVLVAVLTVVSWLIWNRKDMPFIMFVPVAILEWAFAGGMVAVIYRLASPGLTKPKGRQLYAWAIGRPITGVFLGAVVYFVALAGARLLTGTGGLGGLGDALWLNVIAFFGAFRQDLSIRAASSFFVSKMGERDEEKEFE